MLLHENYTAEHIANLQKKTGSDPSILERTVYAFGLLESIQRVGMPFIFKGGTALLILLEHPRRLSTDIDIVVEPGIDVESYVQQASTIFPFLSYETDDRKGANKIEKKHFKFLVKSQRTDKLFAILLDVVFEHNPYLNIVQKPSCLLTNQKEYERVTDPELYHDEILSMKGAKRINYIRNADLSAYAYLVKSFALLHEAGFYRDSIL